MRRIPKGPSATSSSPMMEARMFSMSRSAWDCMATCVGASHELCVLPRAVCHWASPGPGESSRDFTLFCVRQPTEQGYDVRVMPHDILYDSILDAVGHTPLIRLSRIGRNLPCELYGKCEFMNPGGSVKD